ncbi:hypothetical protein BGL_2c14020 [Burkholderia plantarii]|uniref:Uncharacterized protein n=2 Tax=Burkholderia plantarii TaxID=41899 RepID=A0A0B6S4Z1_BURPL|nr:hypothetical protein BGL_2c14020 [Burkholderia plantarii]
MVGLVTSSFNMGIGPVIPSAGEPLGGGASPDFGAADPQTASALLTVIMQALQQLQNALGDGGAPSMPAATPEGMPANAAASPSGVASALSAATGGTTAAATPAGNGTPGGASSSTPAAGSSGGSGTAGTNSDLENAMAQTQAKDPTLYAKTMKDAQSGNGNGLVEDELQAYKEGAITKQQATEEVSGAQSLANQNGGGRINGKVRGEAQDALGKNVIGKGQTRIEHDIVKAFESFTPIGAIIKGSKDKTSKQGPENIIQAGQAVTQQASQTAMQDMQSADPNLAAKFQQDAHKGDGNAMVEDMVQLKSEEQSGQVPDTFTDQDAQMLGSQVGNYGKGKVNSQEEQSFTQAFGADTLYRGSTRGSKAFNKVEDAVGGIMDKVVSPVTDTVGGVDKLVHGDIKGAFKEFGNALAGAATDVAMVVAPEAAPELEVGAMAAEGASAAASADRVLDPILSGARTLGKANDHVNDANDAVNMLTGNNNNGGGSRTA